MTNATKLIAGCGFRSRGGVQDVDTFRVVQGRIVPLLGAVARTKLE